MTRIIAGRGKGRRLKAPAGLETRPTGARVRQTLFDILAPRVAGCRFLDAFAGSGAVGLEALSRGAASVFLIDQGGAAAAAIRENVKALAGVGDVQVFRQDVLVALPSLAQQGRRFDVIFLDPPYAGDLCERSLETIVAAGLLAPGGVAVAQHFHKRPLPERIGSLVRARAVRVGDHLLSFFEEEGKESGSP